MRYLALLLLIGCSPEPEETETIKIDCSACIIACTKSVVCSVEITREQTSYKCACNEK